MTDADQAQRSTRPTDVMASLEAMAEWRLFKSATWLADREACANVDQLVRDLGLVVDDADGRTSSYTPLGRTLEMKLMYVFSGTMDAMDVPMILAAAGLIDEGEADDIYESDSFNLDDEIDAEKVLRPIVQAAWRRRRDRAARHALS